MDVYPSDDFSDCFNSVQVVDIKSEAIAEIQSEPQLNKPYFLDPFDAIDTVDNSANSEAVNVLANSQNSS